MKTNAMSIVACFAVATLCCGCSRTIAFSVVDATTKSPLSDVHVTVESERISMLLPYQSRVDEAGPTPRDGQLELKAIPTTGQWQTSIIFNRVGYLNVRCFYSTGDSIVMHTFVPLNIDPQGEKQSLIHLADGGKLLIRMFPAKQ